MLVSLLGLGYGYGLIGMMSAAAEEYPRRRIVCRLWDARNIFTYTCVSWQFGVWVASLADVRYPVCTGQDVAQAAQHHGPKCNIMSMKSVPGALVT